MEEQLPQASSQAFTRTVVWDFEDLHMLIGTDLPIFGGGTHPCVSLRLRDMSKPINILTGRLFELEFFWHPGNKMKLPLLTIYYLLL